MHLRKKWKDLALRSTVINQFLDIYSQTAEVSQNSDDDICISMSLCDTQSNQTNPVANTYSLLCDDRL